jgi:hypothetical protein
MRKMKPAMDFCAEWAHDSTIEAAGEISLFRSQLTDQSLAGSCRLLCGQRARRVWLSCHDLVSGRRPADVEATADVGAADFDAVSNDAVSNDAVSKRV